MQDIKQINDKQIIVLTAPSGGGKTTLRNHVLATVHDLEFSVSCINRPPRPGEIHGKDYWFKTTEEFMVMKEGNEFLECEEVYPGRWYGTPVSELERVMKKNNHHILLDVDVKGAANIKRQYPQAKVIFITPPSIEILVHRLQSRGDTPVEQLKERVAKAPYELEFGYQMMAAKIFDVALRNEQLENAKAAIVTLVNNFIGRPRVA
jgi:guanylate kinase